MDERSIALIVGLVLAAGALLMFVLERRAVARRRAEGRDVDISDILYFGSPAARANAKRKPIK